MNKATQKKRKWITRAFFAFCFGFTATTAVEDVDESLTFIFIFQYCNFFFFFFFGFFGFFFFRTCTGVCAKPKQKKAPTLHNDARHLCSGVSFFRVFSCSSWVSGVSWWSCQMQNLVLWWLYSWIKHNVYCFFFFWFFFGFENKNII